MGIYIENMKAPEMCGRCPFSQVSSKKWQCLAAHKGLEARDFLGQRPDWCPQQEIDLNDYKTCFICAKRSTCGVFDQGERIERGVNDTPCDDFELEATA